jgi:neutral trehalase
LGHPDQQVEYTAAARGLRQAINKHLWDSRTGAYHGAIKEGKPTAPTAHAAAMALYFDVAPPESRLQTAPWLLGHFAREAPSGGTVKCSHPNRTHGLRGGGDS